MSSVNSAVGGEEIKAVTVLKWERLIIDRRPDHFTVKVI